MNRMDLPMMKTSRSPVIASLLVAAAALSTTAPTLAQTVTDTEARRLFEPVRAVLQHPRCQNCHITGDAPLQYDEGRTHAQLVKRGPDGHGSPGMQCGTCHQTGNPDPALGPSAPPGAPNWHLPPPQMKMVFKDVSAAQLCRTIKDPKQNGDRSLEQFVAHMDEDKLVLWGWAPGGNRQPVTPAHPEVMAAVKRWVSAGAPCPS
jgi:hypothetical protein